MDKELIPPVFRNKDIMGGFKPRKKNNKGLNHPNINSIIPPVFRNENVNPPLKFLMPSPAFKIENVKPNPRKFVLPQPSVKTKDNFETPPLKSLFSPPLYRNEGIPKTSFTPPAFRNTGTKPSFKEMTYNNTGYKTEKFNKKILNIDSGSISAATSFSLDLQEKFRVDKKSDIYLDSFTTLNSKINTGVNDIGFLLKIDEFDSNNSFSNTSGIHNKIFIPNDTTTLGTTITHKGKKLNYVGTINPTEINKLNVTITDLDNSSPNTIFHSSNDRRFLMELIFIENE